MAKYNYGDKVLVRSDLVEGERYPMENRVYKHTVVYGMSDLRGEVVTISKVGFDGYGILEDENTCIWTDGMFASLVGTIPPKEILQHGDVVQDRVGDRWVLLKFYDVDLLLHEDNKTYIELRMYDDDLKNVSTNALDIMSIRRADEITNTLTERFTTHISKIVWRRGEEPKTVEMTLKEISEKLGYRVKVVE